MDECGGLENRWAGDGPGGSNPSASDFYLSVDIFDSGPRPELPTVAPRL